MSGHSVGNLIEEEENSKAEIRNWWESYNKYYKRHLTAGVQDETIILDELWKKFNDDLIMNKDVDRDISSFQLKSREFYVSCKRKLFDSVLSVELKLKKIENQCVLNAGEIEELKPTESHRSVSELLDIEKHYTEEDPIFCSIGQLGTWQIVISVLMMMANFVVAGHHLLIIFLAPLGHNEHWCKTANISAVCSEECKEIEFDRSTFDVTIVTQWNLVCENEHLANLSQAIFMLGVPVGNLIFGTMADKYGRKTPLLTSSMLTIVLGILIVFVTKFWMFCVLRFLLAAATGGLMVMSFVVILEIIGPKWVETFAILYQLPFNLGHLSLAGLGYFLRDWRQLQLTISLLSALQIVYFFTIPESPRWLFATGRIDKAVKTLKQAAKWNKLPDDGIEKIVAEAYKKKLLKTEGAEGKFFDLCRYPNMRLKTFCILFIWLSCGITFFGMAQYIGNITGNIFLNVAISALMCIPATIITIFLCKYYGRRYTLISACAISGTSLLLIACFHENQSTAIVTCASIGMFGTAVAFGTIYLYSGELYPTVVRNIGVGMSSMMSRLGSMVAPFIAGLSGINHTFPPLIIGMFPLVAVVACYFLPETKDRELPDTLKEGEEFRRKR